MLKENRKKPRGGMRPRSRTAGPTVMAAERTVEALELRKAGLSYRQIGERLGISAAAAHKLVSKALGEISERARDVAQETLALELERLDAMTALLWEEPRQAKGPSRPPRRGEAAFPHPGGGGPPDPAHRGQGEAPPPRHGHATEQHGGHHAPLAGGVRAKGPGGGRPGAKGAGWRRWW